MSPIAQLLMGHMQGQSGGEPPMPPMAHMPGDAGGADPGLPPGLPPGGPPPGLGPDGPPPGGGSDREVATTAAQQLLDATHQATDPALKASFATALAALHKWLATDQKEHHQALTGKLSPRLMAEAHGRAA